MDGPKRLILIAALAATTVLTLALGATDPLAAVGYPTRFLAWNLFLAWVPLVCALWFGAVAHRWARWLAGAAWLAFLPNAPYLVTDLVHLGDQQPLWRHVLQFGIAAWTGTLLGVVSLRLVHATVERRKGRLWGWVVVTMSVGLCAIGVVIGRFQRWNSWDLVTRPAAVASSTLEWVGSPFSDVRSTAVAIAVASFFGLAYLTVWAMDGLSTRLSPPPPAPEPG